MTLTTAKTYSSKSNAKRAAMKDGVDANTVEFFEIDNGWAWRPVEAPAADDAERDVAEAAEMAELSTEIDAELAARQAAAEAAAEVADAHIRALMAHPAQPADESGIPAFLRRKEDPALTADRRKRIALAAEQHPGARLRTPASWKQVPANGTAALSAPRAPRGKTADILARLQGPDGITTGQIRELTGWAKLGGVYGAAEKAGLKAVVLRENGDSRWFAIPAKAETVRAFIQEAPGGQWIEYGTFDSIDAVREDAASSAAEDGEAARVEVHKTGAVLIFSVAREAA